ncbi:MAG: hypothetical protein HQL91_00030 [Magnetococcales bacterium]|nr:hypothetical protein [Magnetococcales bacterium]
MMKNPFPVQETRRALSQLGEVSVNAQENLEIADSHQLYLPLRHKGAFAWDASVVVGMRGAGKSVWTAALNDAGIRGDMAQAWGLDQLNRLDVHIAFGQNLSERLFPSPDTLENLLAAFPGLDCALIWKTVLFKRIVQELGVNDDFARLDNWRERVQWVKEHGELSNQIFQQFDQEWKKIGRQFLFVMDALDLLSNDWSKLQELAKGALRLTQNLRMYSSMRIKMFLRPDMFEDDALWTFADSSKLKQSKVELQWSPVDLYGLILQRLVHADGVGKEIRDALDPGSMPVESGRGYRLPKYCRTEEGMKEIVIFLAGKFMGTDPRRGGTFTWIPKHLADAKGRVSPRSMLLAVGEAARITEEDYGTHATALHHEAIRQGVAKASEIRVDELAEDYPWIKPLVDALDGLLVPCAPDELLNRWDERIIKNVTGAGKLPPRKFSTDGVQAGNPALLIDDLEELAVLSRTSDGRINIPDIFRIKSGMKRKGGVRAVR